jgi:hypothetical protein
MLRTVALSRLPLRSPIVSLLRSYAFLAFKTHLGGRLNPAARDPLGTAITCLQYNMLLVIHGEIWSHDRAGVRDTQRLRSPWTIATSA